MAALYAHKQAAGIPMDPVDDRNHTGIIGEAYTGMTTTLGSLEAKRTAAAPDAAAMVVDMLAQLNLPAGSAIAINMSGSFPGLNIAVCCAAQALGLDAICIASAGASTYGANQPSFTYIDMHSLLYAQGLVAFPLRAASVGGEADTGEGMWDPEAPHALRDTIRSHGIPLIDESDLARNVDLRMAVYAQYGPPLAYVNVGGNWVGGYADDAIVPSGIVDPAAVPLTDASEGLLARYLRAQTPCINLLNMKGLAMAYGIAFDPHPLPAIGDAAVYYRGDTGPRTGPLVLVVLLAGLLIAIRRRGWV